MNNRLMAALEVIQNMDQRQVLDTRRLLDARQHELDLENNERLWAKGLAVAVEQEQGHVGHTDDF